MYRKLPQKQVNYHTPKGAKKQLDYILTDRKHYHWSKDAEANDTIDMGSDHICVMAKFEIPKTKKTPRRNKAPSSEIEKDTCEDEHELMYRDLKQEVKEAEPNKIKKKTTKEETEAEARAAAQTAAAAAASTAAADGEAITKNNAEAAEATEASEARETKDKDEEILVLIQERKTTAKHEKERIREISKKIKKCIRENKKEDKTRKIQKILEELKGTRNISSINSVKKRILQTSKTQKAKTSTQDKESQMFLWSSTKTCTKVRKVTKKKEMEKVPDQYIPIPEFTKKDPRCHRPPQKKGKQKTAVV